MTGDAGPADRPGGARAERVRGADGAGAPRGRIVIAAGGTTGVYYALRARRSPPSSRRATPACGSRSSPRAGRWRTCAWSPTGGRRSRSPPPTRPPRPRSAAPPFGRRLPIAALARVYDDYMHLVVPASSRVRSIAQLDGRTVSVGPSGVGHAADRRAPARRARAGLHDVGLGLDASVAALRAGRISAFFWSGGLPTPGVDALAHTEPLRLLGLDERLDGLQARFGAVYRAAAIPSGTYGLTRQVATIAVPNLLVTHERRRRGAGPARHRDAIRAARLDRPRRPGRRRARPPRRDRDRARAAASRRPATGTATPRPEMKQRRASSPRRRGDRSSSVAPLCSSSVRAIARPRPEPSTFWCRRPRQNRSPARRSSSGPRPGPSSRTATTAPSASRSTVTRTLEPAGPNLIALSSTTSSALERATGSASASACASPLRPIVIPLAVAAGHHASIRRSTIGPRSIRSGSGSASSACARASRRSRMPARWRPSPAAASTSASQPSGARSASESRRSSSALSGLRSWCEASARKLRWRCTTPLDVGRHLVE